MKKAFSFVIILHVLFSRSPTAQVRLENLRTENADNPIGLDITHPRFSWQLVSDQRNSKQTAYEIRVGDNPHEMMKSKGTGKMVSDQSLYVPYQGETLKASKRYYWQVRVWYNAGNVSAWSTPAFFQMVLLTSSDWKAAWIVPGFEEDSLPALFFLVATFLYVTCASGLGMLVSMLVRTQQAALMVVVILSVLIALQFSGMLTPVSLLTGPNWWIAHLLPAMYYQNVVLGAFLKGSGFGELWLDALLLALFALVLLALVYRLFRKRTRT